MPGMKRKQDETRDSGLPSLSRKEFVILEMLIENGRELFGLEMVEASDNELKRGTVYVTLQRMQEKGLVDSKPEARPTPEIGIARRVYSVTGYGHQVYRAHKVAKQMMNSLMPMET